MKLLIDTNILIPLEPTAPSEVTGQTTLAARLANLASQTGAQLWLHPAQRVDIAQDLDENRRSTRDQLFGKYPVLNLPLGNVPDGATNDWVDAQLIDALRRNAVTALVTDDRRLTKKALQELPPERVLTLADAITGLSGLLDQAVEPPPAVEGVQVYALNLGDPFWDSFRRGYPGFDAWFRKCQEDHRDAWVIRSSDGVGLAGATIVNHEREEVRGTKTLKICSLKVDATHSGRRYGELLLKAIFQHAYRNRFDSLFITVFPEHAQLIALLQDFGFVTEPPRPSGELALAKQLDLTPPAEASKDPLRYFIERGPFVADLHGPPAFIIPIRPEFHRMLFPDLQDQPSLLDGSEAHGNGLRKAYLSTSNITKLVPGSTLFFYRSGDDRSVGAWGVVEDVRRSQDADEICGFVLPRTVYSREQIVGMCARGQVLSIMFRQGLRRIEPKISYADMHSAGVLRAAPQSITSLTAEAKEWMRVRCQSS